MAAPKSQSPDQAPEVVAELALPHLHRRHVYWDWLKAGLGSQWRSANARYLRQATHNEAA